MSRNIFLPKETGFEIESGRSGSYLDERDFTDAELRVLIDGVFFEQAYCGKVFKRPSISSVLCQTNIFVLALSISTLSAIEIRLKINRYSATSRSQTKR